MIGKINNFIKWCLSLSVSLPGKLVSSYANFGVLSIWLETEGKKKQIFYNATFGHCYEGPPVVWCLWSLDLHRPDPHALFSPSAKEK